MKTWKTILCACRSRKTGRFSNKGKCKAFKRTKLRAVRHTLFAIALALPLLTGCHNDPFVSQTPVLLRDSLTNIVTVLQTNTVTLTNLVQIQAPSTNVETGAVVPAVYQPQVTILTAVQTNFVAQVQPAIWYTNLALASPVTTGVNIGSQAASALGVPFVGAVPGLVTALSGLVFGFVNLRRKREAEAKASASQDEHDKTKAVLAVASDAVQTLTENFESLRGAALQIPAYKAIDNQVMQAVKTAQAVAGPAVKTLIHDSVEQFTNDTIKTPLAPQAA